eukprot:3469889-Amphidinium_carterae.2
MCIRDSSNHEKKRGRVELSLRSWQWLCWRVSSCMRAAASAGLQPQRCTAVQQLAFALLERYRADLGGMAVPLEPSVLRLVSLAESPQNPEQKQLTSATMAQDISVAKDSSCMVDNPLHIYCTHRIVIDQGS